MPRKPPPLPKEHKSDIMGTMTEHQPFDYSLHLEGRLARLEAHAENNAVQMNRLEARMDKLDDRMDKLNGRMDRLESSMHSLHERMDRLDARMDKLDDKIDRNFFWTLGMFATMLVSMLGVMAKGFGWLG